MSAHVAQARDGSVLRLILTRPEKKNALTDAMYGALADGLAEAAADPALRVALVTSAGPDFTAGNDIADFATVASGESDLSDRHVLRFLDTLVRFPKPLVAAVPGFAVGIGMTLLLHCDYVLLGESARLSAPFANLALVPEAGSSLLLPARLGHPRAFALFALGETVDAATALAWGLANRVVPDARLADEAAAVTTALAARAPGALRETKRLLRDPDRLAAVVAAETKSFRAQLQTPEARAAFEAFVRRPPRETTA